jgi:hypothetical protein
VPTPGLAVLESDLATLEAVLAPWTARVAGLIGERAAPALAQ